MSDQPPPSQDLARQNDIEAVDVEQVARPDLLNRVTDSWIASVAEVGRLARYLCDTEFVPDGLRGKGGAPVAAAILYGRELGLPPMTALSSTHVIKGRVGVSAEILRSLVLAAGHEIEVVETTSSKCVMRGRRRGSQTWTPVTWSIGDAQVAKLGGEGWTKYPRQMLQARCSAELCRLVFPDVIHGMSAVEELDEGGVPALGGAAAAQAPKRLVQRAERPKAAQVPPPTLAEVTLEQPPATVERPPLPGDEPEQPPQSNVGGEQRGPVEPSADRADRSAPDVASTPGGGLPGSTPDPRPVPDAPPAPPGRASEQQKRMTLVLLQKLEPGMTRQRRLSIAQAVLNRPSIGSFNDLDAAQASTLIDTLARISDSPDPSGRLEYLLTVAGGEQGEPEQDAEPGDGPDLYDEQGEPLFDDQEI